MVVDVGGAEIRNPESGGDCPLLRAERACPQFQEGKPQKLSMVPHAFISANEFLNQELENLDGVQDSASHSLPPKDITDSIHTPETDTGKRKALGPGAALGARPTRFPINTLGTVLVPACA